MQGFYYKPRIDPIILMEHLEGVIVTTACSSSFIFMEGGEDLVKQIAKKTDIYLEVMPHILKEQTMVNQNAVAISRRNKLPLIMANDCHYITEDQWELQDVLLAMQTKKKMSDPNRFKFDIRGLHLRSLDEMLIEFSNQGVLGDDDLIEALENTNKLAESCDLFIEKQEVHLPRVYVPQYKDENETDQLIQLSLDGLEYRAERHPYIKEKYDEYTARLEEELGLIIELGFERYFLIVWELIRWCKDNDIMCGPGRGSVGGSLVAYVLGITMVDPIAFDLVFSRFISPARIDLPDIDMDFEDIKRPQIRQHLEDLYGRHNVVGLSTFTKMNGKSAIRDVARVFDIPKADVDPAAKCIVVRSLGDFRSSYTIEDAFAAFEDGIKYKRKHPKATAISMAMEHQIKGAGKHAAAMCVSANDLRTGENAAYMNRTSELVCNWEKEDAEYMGLMKLDVLGLNALTVLHGAQKLIKDRHDVDIDFELIPLDDEKVFEEFTQGNNIGVFQFAGHWMIKLCREILVEDFEEVVALNALDRPGALRSGMTTDYRERKHGRQPIPTQHPIQQKITEKTHGIVLYQEQIMYIMYNLAGLPWKTADMVRKVISKSKGEEQFMKFRQMFIDGCVERKTVPAEGAGQIFDTLKHFGSYGFNRAHAVEYAMIAYWDMWLKVHYPLEFMVALLSYGQGGDKKADHVAEARRMGLKLALPDMNRSHAKDWRIDENNNLIIPFQEIKGVGPKSAEAILAARVKYGDFLNKENFVDVVPKRQVNSRIVGILERAGVFGGVDLDNLEESELEELESLSELFEFDLSNDPMYRFRRVIKVILSQIEQSSIMGPDKEH
jgi:DNA polymerase-3 subunit alpha